MRASIALQRVATGAFPVRGDDHDKALGKLVRMRNSTSLDALAGQYRLHPGCSPSIVGQRPVLGGGRLGHLLQGQQGEQVGRTLGSLFTLCAHAHRRMADMVLAAASELPQAVAACEAPVMLLLETARDHLRNIALDWPQRLPEFGAGAPSMDWLRDCPLSLGTVRPPADADAAWQALTAFRAWMESAVLQQGVAQWLAEQREPEALAQWCSAHAGRLLPARCLAAWHPLAGHLRPPMRRLDLLDEDTTLQTAQLRELAQTMAADADFVQRPTWRGQCAETGPWTRLRHRHAQQSIQTSAWTRLSARWLELMELAAADPGSEGPGGAALLASGALHLGEGQALAWCEMARGLLLHWVQLDVKGAVQDYRVLAPTEWNFHPDGSLAQTLAALSPGDTAAARTLASAFDPCVSCTV